MSAQETVERALALSKADDCIVIATERFEANLRWANNTLTTNGEMRSRQLAVISIIGPAAGVITRSSVTDDDLETVVRASEQAARDAGPADDAMPLVAPGADYGAAAQFDDTPGETSIGVYSSFAPALGAAFEEARAQDRLLFGFAEHIVETAYVGTSTGLRLRHVQPTGRLELNAKSADLSRSVWGGLSTADFADVDVPALDATLQTKLDWAQRQIDLAPGRYETLLPPGPVADLMIYLYWSATARDADEGRTVFSKKGGGSRLGERLTDVPLTLRSDPAAAGMACRPFALATASGSHQSVFDNGLPVTSTEWIQDGTLSSLINTRSWAQREGGTAAPPIDNLILDGGGTASIEEMIASTSRGLLLTCLWYIREVDPQTLLLTGLTRDGVFLVENGEVTGAVNNFRFNESPVDMLSRVSEVGVTEKVLCREWNDFFNRSAMPTLRVADFNMSTVSQAS